MTKFIKLFLLVLCVGNHASSQSQMVFYVPNVAWEQVWLDDSSSVFVTWCSTDFIICDQADSSIYFCSSGVNYQIDEFTLSLAVESVTLWRLQKRLFCRLPQLRCIYSEAVFRKPNKWSKVEELSMEENRINLNGVEYVLWNGHVNFNLKIHAK